MLTRTGSLLATWLSAVLLAIGGAFISAPSAYAAGTGGYPYASYNGPGTNSSTFTWTDSTGNEWSPYGYAYRNCTDYVAWKLQSLGAPDSKTRGLGNGGQWAARANGRAGVAVNNTPAYGAAAVNTTFAAPYGHVSFVESVNSNGTITVSEYNFGTKGNYGTRTGTPAQLGVSSFVHFGLTASASSQAADGNLLIAPSGAVYVVAGGAALKVMSFDNVPAGLASQNVAQSVIDSMSQYPRDGTVIRNHKTGSLAVVAGGAPMTVMSASNIPSSQPVNVDWNAALSQLRQYPVNGTVLANHVTNAVVVVAGGAGLKVMDMSNIPASTAVRVDGWAIANQLRQYPIDGTVLKQHQTGAIAVVAGGAAMTVMNSANIPSTGWVYVDWWAVTNQLRQYPVNGTILANHVTNAVVVVAGGAGVRVTSMSNISAGPVVRVDGWAIINQLRQYPTDGTVLHDHLSGSMAVVAGGAPMTVMSFTNYPYTSYVDVDWKAAQDQLPDVPSSGTYVTAYQSNKLYQVTNGIAYRSYASGVNSTKIDAWAITNQLKATE